jgi:hypothetical protein
MSDQVRVGLTFSRSGQELFIHVPREMAHSIETLSPTQLMAIMDRHQRFENPISMHESRHP